MKKKKEKRENILMGIAVGLIVIAIIITYATVRFIGAEITNTEIETFVMGILFLLVLFFLRNHIPWGFVSWLLISSAILSVIPVCAVYCVVKVNGGDICDINLTEIGVMFFLLHIVCLWIRAKKDEKAEQQSC